MEIELTCCWNELEDSKFLDAWNEGRPTLTKVEKAETLWQTEQEGIRQLRESDMLEWTSYIKLKIPPASYVLQRVVRRCSKELSSPTLLGMRGPKTIQHRWKAKCVQSLL